MFLALSPLRSSRYSNRAKQMQRKSNRCICVASELFMRVSLLRTQSKSWTNPWTTRPKGLISFKVKWCADFSDTPLLTCGFIVFRDGVRKSVLPILLLPLSRALELGQLFTSLFPQVKSLIFRRDMEEASHVEESWKKRAREPMERVERK